MTFLLDVNVLVALIAPDHPVHDAAHRWFDDEGQRGWATCPLTENGALRVLGDPKLESSPGTPGGVIPMLRSLLDQGQRTFWTDDLSLTASPMIDATRLLRREDVTDTHLLALAASRGGYLATFDRKLRTDTVKGGRQTLFQIPT
ncbi:MAG: VapC toxin family PIN domain ribonuclease [Alphaproteobacteria bacterium]|nr:VapC toxin family PIN domain ribonuclease [Alphaproteobacteria bacterium]MBU2377705.1 VapC toxin family PIN domain ribonuclease [Alphaproteobacteria bacterium]